MEQAVIRPLRSGWFRDVVALVTAAALSFAAAAAEPARPYRIGVINEAWAANHPAVEGLRAGLRELGFVEGRDVVFDIHFTRGKPGAADAAAQELLKAEVDLIFTSDYAPTVAARKATRSIPIVFTLVGDPVAVQLVDSLAAPGGNVTGISSLNTELAPKRVELLKHLDPGVRRIWFIYDSTGATDLAVIAKLELAAQQLRVELVSRGVDDAASLSRALKELKRGDALFAPASNTLDIPVEVLNRALALRVPAVFPSSFWITHGALISYGPDFRAQGVQAARLVAKILRGARPQDVPVESAEKIDLALNLKTVRQLGLTLPRTMLFRADIVLR
jgi:putative ABC transport system substrate-binding protein